MSKWRMTIDVNDDIIRRYHELTPEDPETDQTLIGDWLSDLVIDAKRANDSYASVPAAEDLTFTRAGRPGGGNLIFVGAERVDGDDAADATAEYVKHLQEQGVPHVSDEDVT